MSSENRKAKKMKNFAAGDGDGKCALFNSASKDELLVAEILLNLGNLISAAESRSVLKWGCRRTRSSATDAVSLNDEVREPPPKKLCTNNGDAASPATPLSLSLSESDEKSKKNYKKRARDEYTETLHGLTHQRDLLRTELEKVGNNHKKLKIKNSQLKSMKQELLLPNCCPRKDETSDFVKGEIGGQPLIIHRMDEEIQPSIGLGFLLDLNLTAEEAELKAKEEADKRAKFCEARRIRRGIIKMKSLKTDLTL